MWLHELDRARQMADTMRPFAIGFMWRNSSDRKEKAIYKLAYQLQFEEIRNELTR